MATFNGPQKVELLLNFEQLWEYGSENKALSRN